MSTSFGRTTAKVLPILAVAALGAATASQANTISRNGTLPGHKAESHVKHNAGPGPAYYAGGATLPAIAYVGQQAATATFDTVPGVGTSSTVFGYFISNVSANRGNDTITYCQTGSGFGKKVMDGVNVGTGSLAGEDAQLPCATLGNSPVTGVNGFGAGGGQPFGDFSGSDAPLSSSEYTAWSTNYLSPSSPIYGHGLPTQIPFVVGSVAIFYNNPDLGSSVRLNLTAAQLCKLAGGYISNWSQLGYPSRPLVFVGRKDGSGTTFSISNHLNNFSVSQQYYEYSPNSGTGVLPNPLNPGENLANIAIASGNPGVALAIENNPGYIGYVEAANALSLINGANLNYAEINGKDPIADLPKSAGAITGALIQGQAIGSDVQNGRAPFVTLSPADNCVYFVSPLKYSRPPGYPIIGVSNLEFSQALNGANAADLQALATTLINKTPENVGPGKITSVDLYGKSSVGTTGFSTLNQATYQKVIKAAASSCIGA